MIDSNKSPSVSFKGPGNFTGNKKDWETWAFIFANYAKNIDFRLGKAFAEIEALGKGTDVDSDWIDDFDLNNPNTATASKDLKQLDSELYGYLSEILTGTAQPCLERKVFCFRTCCLEKTCSETWTCDCN